MSITPLFEGRTTRFQERALTFCLLSSGEEEGTWGEIPKIDCGWVPLQGRISGWTGEKIGMTSFLMTGGYKSSHTFAFICIGSGKLDGISPEVYICLLLESFKKVNCIIYTFNFKRTRLQAAVKKKSMVSLFYSTP